MPFINVGSFNKCFDSLGKLKWFVNLRCREYFLCVFLLSITHYFVFLHISKQDLKDEMCRFLLAVTMLKIVLRGPGCFTFLLSLAFARHLHHGPVRSQYITLNPLSNIIFRTNIMYNDSKLTT